MMDFLCESIRLYLVLPTVVSSELFVLISTTKKSWMKAKWTTFLTSTCFLLLWKTEYQFALSTSCTSAESTKSPVALNESNKAAEKIVLNYLSWSPWSIRFCTFAWICEHKLTQKTNKISFSHYNKLVKTNLQSHTLKNTHLCWWVERLVGVAAVIRLLVRRVSQPPHSIALVSSGPWFLLSPSCSCLPCSNS